ncbi:NAD(P)H-dependent oxidoreductase subunit E [Pontiella agarivorans]|uniref:NAD(P)H-dependent oxidoreductase subunit E n=1 Tax=Pontiella agarivorans TaxID=3038953 RepID=A0ABU5MUB3_9BACT|nr:NAD(P)H-dependent oxidoreductase subunit E [Pontiella agarivorans]MDZ8117718.1 NAD(P)H-dependent oxidoreductase subunit E [Pontiella agarivorans]
MKTVNVSICTGTACHLMGGAHLLTFDEMLDPVTAGHVTLTGSHCLGLCGDEKNGKAPFARVNDRIISDATLNKLLRAVREEIGLESD